MPLESPIIDLSSLNKAWPKDSDLHSETDDHIRNCKKASKQSFTSLSSAGGIVTITATEFNAMQGVTSNVQSQLTDKLPSWTYSENSVNFAAPGDNLLINATSSGFWNVRLPDSPPDGTQILVKVFSLNLDFGTQYVFQILRQGTNTLTDLVAKIAGAQSITPASEFRTWYCVYFSSVWYCWPLRGG